MGYYLGLFGYGPNPSAALVRDGRIVAFAEEERFNRIKTAPNSLPVAEGTVVVNGNRIAVEVKRLLPKSPDMR